MGTKKDDITASVTELEQTPWEAVGVSKQEWDITGVPEFLRRKEPSCIPQPVMPKHIHSLGQTPRPPAPVPFVGEETGSKIGLESYSKGDEFARFRVDPDEIEQQIKLEADRRWREWLPTKLSRHRPRKSWYEKQVRKEFYK